MYKRLVLMAFFAAAVAVAVSLFSSSPASATNVYPINGKATNNDLPEIKWEYGEPGDSAYGRIGYLDSFTLSSNSSRDFSKCVRYQGVKLKDIIEIQIRSVIFLLRLNYNFR